MEGSMGKRRYEGRGDTLIRMRRGRYESEEDGKDIHRLTLSCS
jgi:hypothetical protein